MRQAITAIAVIAVLFTATCGGHQRNEAHDAALTPTISQLSTFNSKLASVIPADVRLVARDAGIALSAGGYTLSWKYENPGDYSQDGIVALEDIAPLSEHFSEAATLENEWIDGSGDGVVGVADITPIAMNWSSEVTGYRIDGAEATEGPWSEVASIELADADASNGRLVLAQEIAPGFTFYRVITLTPDGDAAFTEPLVAPSNEPIIYGVSPLSGYQHEEYTFAATASGQEPLTYAWDFGGGATPNTSSDISPTVTLSDAGEYSATLTISNSYGPTTFPFTLTVSARDMWTHTWKGLGWSSGSGLLLDDTSVYISGSDNEDALLMKYSQDGNLLWAREYGIEGSDSLIGCVVDAEGNIVAGGSSYALGEGNTDLMLLKYSHDGELIRAMAWGTGDYEYCGVKGFSTDAQGNLYQCGSWCVYGGELLALIVKYDPDWNVIWAKLWGGTSSDVAAGIASVDDAIYVCGETESFGAPEGDAFILKMDEDGNVLWARTWGTERSDVFYSVVVGLDGSAYAVGNSSGPGDEYFGIVVKYGSDGIAQKTLGWDETGTSMFNCIALNPYAGVTVAGISTEGLLVLEANQDLTLLKSECWLGALYGQRPNNCMYDNDCNLFITGFSETPFGEWAEQADLSYAPIGLSTEIEGSTWELNGISNEATGIETSPEGAVDSVTNNQLLIMKNYPK